MNAVKKTFSVLLSIVLIAAMLVSCSGKPAESASSAEPSSAPSPEPESSAAADSTPEASPVPELIVTSDQFIMDYDSMTINASTILYDANILALDLESPSLDGCVLPVRLSIDSVDTALDKELFFEANRPLTDPKYIEYNEERITWANNRRNNKTSEEQELLKDAAYDEEMEYFYQLFDEDWRSNHTEEEFALIEDTLKQYHEGMERYEELKKHGDDWNALFNERLGTEIERLESKGIVILGTWETGRTYYALIPIERMRDFPENIRYGYAVMWLTDKMVENPDWIVLMKEHGCEGMLDNVRAIYYGERL